ncbi:flagellar hook-length control protein FliK [Candidatus Formimonas warabiya]|uniref:Flagellar hook-length control protein-like C-terminal domain-containing protein n=1 Tax=Formimonas warabiya TaxID=1761012 RepID=A0A3G1KS14_FORW1|nr:flagellar hook-length control protein FliK [Candidatus Formimonas warabiya]ATW25248.1 hypothetical protein DCMF_11145 [Candidatus Formimonas warabiya]
MSLDKINSVWPLTKYQQQHESSQLNKGDIFRATVVDVKNDQVVLRIRGELLQAASTVPLKAGETALFQVKEIKDRLLVLKKQESFLPLSGEKTMGSLLEELGLPVSPEGKQVVSHLLSKELPLSKNLIEQILKGLNGVPENLKESFIKIKTWLVGAGITDPEVQQNLLSTLLNSREALHLLEKLLTFYQRSGTDPGSAFKTVLLEKLLRDLSSLPPEEKGVFDYEALKRQLSELISFQKTVNQSRLDNPRLPDLVYYPIPLQQGESRIPAQIYLVMKDKSQAAFQEQVSLLLSLQTENMGMLWFDIRIKGMALNITAFTEHQDISAYLNRTWELLKDGLEGHQFKVNSFSCREKRVTSVFELADDLGNEEIYRSLDIKI